MFGFLSFVEFTVKPCPWINQEYRIFKLIAVQNYQNMMIFFYRQCGKWVLQQLLLLLFPE
jgi:hypothetical protein